MNAIRTYTRRVGILLVFAILTDIGAGEEASSTAPTAMMPLYVLHGLNFSPYIDEDEDADRGDGQIAPEELQERMQVIAPYTEWIRTFGCNGDLRDAGMVAHDLGLQGAIGAWLGRDPVENQNQIDCLIEEATEGHVDVAIVGSEVLLRGDLNETDLIARIDEVRQAFQDADLDIPVTTADVYGVLLDHPAVLDAVDLVLVNYYPYWEGRPLDQAMAIVHIWHQAMMAAAGGKEVVVSESGWPSCGERIGEAVPSPENAAFYFLNFVSWARANEVRYFYFETYDEQWKIRFEGPQGGCWGLWDRDGSLKDGMQSVFDDETLLDNWSDPPSEEPIIDFPAIPDVTVTNISTFLVAGHTDPGNAVFVNGSPLPLEAMDVGGNFAFPVQLVEGDNVIALTIETVSGDLISRNTKTVTYASAFSTLDRRLIYIDVVDVAEDQPALSGTVVIDLDSNAVLGIIEDKHIRGISPGATEIYTHDNTVIGTDFHEVKRILPFSQESSNNSFLVSPDGTRLYSRDEIVDAAMNELFSDRLPRPIEAVGSWASAPIPGDPAISANGRYIYCCSNVTKIDTETLEEIGSRGSSSAFETDIAITTDGSTVFVADYSFANGRLKSYDSTELSVLLDSVSGLGDFAGEIVFSAAGDRAVVGSAGNPASPTDGRVSVIDLNTWEIIFQQTVPLADNLVTSGNDEFIVASGESGLFRRLGIQVFVLEPVGTLVRTKTFFLGINRYERSSGRPRNDRIRKLVFKRRFEPPTLTVTKVGAGSGTVSSEPAGIDCDSLCSAPFESRTKVTLTAVADVGSHFVGWSGACDASGQVTIAGHRTCTATFDLDTHALVVTKSGKGSGSVTSQPAGIDCGSACSAPFDFETAVTLIPIADIGSRFLSWSGDCSASGQVTMAGDRACRGTFDLADPGTLTVTKGGTGSGTVTSDPEGIDCGPRCSTPFDFGTVVNLTAKADEGSHFVGWSGDCDTSGQVVSAGEKECKVTFDRPQVRAFYLVPSDRDFREDYKRAIEHGLENLRPWFQREMGNTETFALFDPLVEDVATSYPAAFYATQANGEFSQWFRHNVLADAFSLTGGSFSDPHTVWVYYIDADPACGQIEGWGDASVVMLPANDLRGLAGESDVPPCSGQSPENASVDRWIGGFGKELGGALGLETPPGCEQGLPTCDSEALMWLGFRSYPDTRLTDSDRETLDQSPFFRPGPWCVGRSTAMCLNDERFQVRVDWRDFRGAEGPGRVVPFGSDDSGLLWFFDPDNWEMLVKVLDGCAFNQRFWVFSAATTNVEYTLRVTDTLSGQVSEYTNPLGNVAPAITDIGTFVACPVQRRGDDRRHAARPRKPGGMLTAESVPAEQMTCTLGATHLCLNRSRFRVEVEWRDSRDNIGLGKAVPFGSDDAGLLWFFSPDNWEVLVKVLDGCALNQHFWVLSAATTDVEYTLWVTDTETGAVKRYFNQLGNAADAIIDSRAFAICP